MFKQWGDNANYFLITQGDFESVSSLPTGSWAIQKGNVSIATDDAPTSMKPKSKVLKLTTAIDGSGLNAAAQSQYHCMLPNQAKLRFMVRTPDTAGVRKALVVVDDKVAGISFIMSGTLYGKDYLSWKPGPTGFWFTEAQVKRAFGRSLSTNYDISVVFEALKGTWFVDDVAIDPFRSR